MTKVHRDSRQSGRLRAYTHQLFAPGVNHRRLLGEIKSAPPELFPALIERALSVPGPRQLILGHPFPETLKSLLNSTPLESSQSLELEIRWATELLLPLAHRLNAFLAAMRRFESSLLSQDWAAARAALNESRTLVGRSLWELECDLILRDLEGGIRSTRALLSEIFEAKPSVLVKIFAYFASMRAEQAPSAVSYDAATSDYFDTSTNEPNPNRDVFYNLRLRLNFHSLLQFEPERLAAALAEDARAPIVDRYLLLVRILQIGVAASFPTELRSIAAATARRLGDVIDDPRLQPIALLGGHALQHRHAVPTSLLPAIDKYTMGQYRDAAAESLAAIRSAAPATFLPYELWGRASLHAQSDGLAGTQLPPLQASLLELVRRTLSRRRDAEDALNSIHKYAYRLSSIPFGDEVFAFYLKHRLPQHPLDSERFGISAAEQLTPRIALGLGSPAEAATYVSTLDAAAAGSPTIDLFKEILAQIQCGTPAPFSFTLPPERELKYQALVLERCRMFREAASKYEQLAELSPAAPMVQTDATIGLYNCLLSLGELDRCVALVVDAYISQGSLLSPSQVAELVRRCEKKPSLSSVHDPAYPILYYMRHREGGRAGVVDPLYLAYDRFLSEAGVSTPMALRPRVKDFPLPRLIFFLRYVCVPDVMDSSIAYESTDTLEGERVGICQWLRELDPSNEDAYAEEISLLQKRSAIRRAMRSADRSKVYIDVAGIKAALPEGLRDLFERFQRIGRLDPARRDLLPEQLKSSTPDLTIVVSDESLKLHKRLFEELRNRFIASHEHGLDSYLSVRIRHGTLAGQIRNSFERFHLATRRDSRTGSYESNEHWLSRVSGNASLYDSYCLNECLGRFSAAADAIIDEVKTRWIQIRTADLPDAYFDFDFSDADLAVLSVLALEAGGFDAFVDIIFDALWKRTESDLADLRAAITGSLLERLTGALDQLRNDVAAIGGAPSELQSSITNCGTAVQNELRQISDWFVVAREGTLDDFQIGVAVEASIEIVRKTFPLDVVSVEANGEGNLMLKGQAFSHFLDLLYILVENVIKHSRPLQVPSTVTVGTTGGRLKIEVANQLSTGASAAELASRVPELEARVRERARPESIRKEGGTGFYKLGKILEHDLKASNWSVHIVLTEDRWFRVTLEMDLEGLAV